MLYEHRICRPIDGHTHGREMGKPRPEVTIDQIVRRIQHEKLHDELTMQSLWRDVRWYRETEFSTTGLLPRIIGQIADFHQAAVMMPNLSDAILTAKQALDYQAVILVEADNKNFRPLMVIQITESTTPEMIFEAWAAGIRFAKIYPKSVTNNSANGVSYLGYFNLRAVFEAMQQCGMALLIHGEHPDPDIYTLDREVKFLEQIMPWIVKNFPRLKIVLEHISTKVGVEYVASAPKNVRGSLTTHLNFITTNDILGHKNHTHSYCRPPAQRKEDQRVLRDATLGLIAPGKFYSGTDNANHAAEDKENADGSPGCSMPGEVYLALQVQMFDEAGRLAHHEPFTSTIFSEFHEVERQKEELSFERSRWVVPKHYNGLVPFWTGQPIDWQIAKQR